MTRSSLTVALLVAAMTVVVTIGSLGATVAFSAGGLVLVGAVVGRLRLAVLPLAVGGGLAVLAVATSRPDAGEWGRVLPVVLVFAGIGASVCVALGAFVRRLDGPRRTSRS